MILLLADGLIVGRDEATRSVSVRILEAKMDMSLTTNVLGDEFDALIVGRPVVIRMVDAHFTLTIDPIDRLVEP